MNNSRTPSVWKREITCAGLLIQTRTVKTILTFTTSIVALCGSASLLLAADPFAVVEVPDPILQAAIRTTLNKPTGDITAADMESLTVLDASRTTRGCAASIQSLEGLQAAINLTSLNLSGEWYEDFFVSPWFDTCATPAVLNTGDLSPLSPLGKLQSLFLFGNGLSNLTLPTGLTNLQTLELFQNTFAYQNALRNLALPEDMTNLRVLSVNGVTNTSFLHGLPRLRQLTWEAGAFFWWMGWDSPGEIIFPQGLFSLEHLTLNGAVTNVVFPPDLTNLHTLRLHGNFADAAFLEPLWNLRTLALEYNRLETLPDGLTNIVELDLTGNPLTNVSFLSDLKNLTQLNLSDCTLSNETRLQVLNELTQLRKLDLSHNGVTSFPMSPESGLTNLVELDLWGNPLADLSFLNRLTRLTLLRIGSCALSNHTDLQFLNALTRLRVLDLRYNGITKFQVPRELVFLESLLLAENRLTSFVLANSYPRLEELDLRLNQLTAVDLAGARQSLKRVDLSGNPLTGVPFLENFSRLEVLDFYTRDLTTFTLPWGLTSLRTLGLRSGMLIPGELPSLAPKSAKLTIDVVSPNFTYVGIPASTDLSQLTLRGHWKNRVTVLGLWMRPPTLRPDGKIGLRISGAAGRTVQVQSSTNLVNWDNWQSVVLGENGAELVAEPSSAPMRYFRPVEVPGH